MYNLQSCGEHATRTLSFIKYLSKNSLFCADNERKHVRYICILMLMIGVDKMDWIERLNQAINYIEEHFKDDIDYEQLGKIACCSGYHFQRMFAYMAGIPLSEYIRRRKMSLAAVDLQFGDKKIIDIASEYGYQSPTAFNRAFQSIYGVAPSAVKKEGVSIKSFPPIVFKITVKGVEEMNYRIEKKDAFRIIGVSQPLEKEVENNFAVVPKMWQEASLNGTVQRLAGLMDSEPMGLLGVSACNDAEQWKYFIAVSSTKETKEYEEYIVPSATWAIFTGTGTNIRRKRYMSAHPD